MGRHLERIRQLDPETEFTEIYRISSQYEFPWDTTQALGFALYRTYAVPSIGRLLAETGEFTARTQKRYDDTVLILEAVVEHGFALYRTYAVPSIGRLLARTGEFTARTQKRYDDTVLILEAVVEHGFDSVPGREAVRRMNQMHRRYEITNEDFVYVLSTFVVVPKRWLDEFGWRPYSPVEVRAAVNYYRELGRRMGLCGIPETYDEFERLLDDYERANFAFDQGGRDVSDATLDLTASWYPGPLGGAMRYASLCLLDDPLREAFGYRRPPAALRFAVRSGMRLRGRFVRLLPPRRKPHLARDGRQVRGYPNGYRVSELGTFEDGRAGGCPFPHTSDGADS